MKMLANYKAWTINHEDFYKFESRIERLGFLVGYAILAPSSHNSQPWKFRVNEEYIELVPEHTRWLPKSDARYRQLFLALGCALENIIIASDYYGLRPKLSFVEKDGVFGARLDYKSADSLPRGPQSHLIFSIAKRCTCRAPFERRLPEKSLLELVKGFSDERMRIDFVVSPEDRKAMAELTRDALIEALDDPEFRLELSRHTKSNITKSKTGMPASGFGMPTAISLIAPFLVRSLNVYRINGSATIKLLAKDTPVIAVISSKNDGCEDWIRCGRMFERIALECQSRGIKTAPMAAAVEIGSYSRKLQDLLHTDFRPQVFFRMGYSKKEFPHSPRIPACEIISA